MLDADSILHTIDYLMDNKVIRFTVWKSGRLTYQMDGKDIDVTDERVIINVANRMKDPRVNQFDSMEKLIGYCEKYGDNTMPGVAYYKAMMAKNNGRTEEIDELDDFGGR